MSEHLFAWVAGFGWSVMPFTPCRISRWDGHPRSIVVEYLSTVGAQRALLHVGEDGRSVETQVLEGTESAETVFELVRGAAFEFWNHGASYDDWHIETSLFVTCWPIGFSIRSVQNAPPPFELKGPGESLIWIQGPLSPERLPPVDRFNGPGQETIEIAQGRGGTLIELSYQHNGTPWRMFHALVERYDGAVFIVSGQSPAVFRELVRDAVQEIASSLTPMPNESS